MTALKLTDKQRVALLHLRDTHMTFVNRQWVSGERLHRGNGRSLSTLVPKGLVDVRHDYRSKLNDYKLTSDGWKLAEQLRKESQ